MGEDWPQFRGPNRDGRAASTGINQDWRKERPKLTRVITGAGQGFSSLCVIGTRIYTTGNFEGGQFAVCLDLETGKTVWRRLLVDVIPNHAVSGARSTPTASDNRLFVTSSDGQVFCLDRLDGGKIIWNRSFQREFGGRIMSGWGYSESPLADEGRVLVTPGGEGAMVVALSESDGSVIWKCGLDETSPRLNFYQHELKFAAGYSSIIRADSLGSSPQYVQLTGSGILGIDSETGKLLWESSHCANRISNICMPIVSGNRVAYSTAPGGGTAILKVSSSGSRYQLSKVRIYRGNEWVCHHGGMVLHDGHLYFGHGENRGNPICIELNTGKRKWGGTFRGAGRGSASVIYVDNRILYRYQNGVVALVAADPTEYRPLGHFTQEVKSNNQSWSHPVVVDGKLLLREHDSIMVYDLR